MRSALDSDIIEFEILCFSGVKTQTMDERIKGYPPVIGNNAQVLIVGSMPSVESLKNGFYYAHPRNAFWRILSGVLNRPLPASIDEKIRLIKENRIILWDVYAACERKGSLDSAIKNGEINDFRALIRENPTLKAVLANGGEAFRKFPKSEAEGLEILPLPSTSPAYTMPFEEKLLLWKSALNRFLGS